MSEDCLFCKIASGRIASTEVYSDDDVYAFRDMNPAAPTHILIVPRKHIAKISDAEPEDEALLGKLILRGNQIAEQEGLKSDGFRYIVNCGTNGGQTVFHIHLHLLGGRNMSWPPG